jgi:hypothetical protein
MLYPSDWGPYQPARSSSQRKRSPSARCSNRTSGASASASQKPPSCILPAADARAYGAECQGRVTGSIALARRISSSLIESHFSRGRFHSRP